MEVGEIGDGAGLGDELLVEDAAESDHGEARVLDLAKLHRREVVLAEPQRVEAEVAGGRALLHSVAAEGEAHGAARGLAVEEDVDVAEKQEDLQPALRRDLRPRRRGSSDQKPWQRNRQGRDLTALKLAAG